MQAEFGGGYSAAADTPHPDAEESTLHRRARIHAITGCGWDERAVTWNTQPAIDGAVMSTVGPVARGATASFDVKAAIGRDGVYCLAIESPSTDEVQYNSREATAGQPELVVQVTP